MAIISEGARVVLRGDSSSLVRSFKTGVVSAKTWQAATVAAIAAVVTRSLVLSAQLDRQIRLNQTLLGKNMDVTRSMAEMSRGVRDLGIQFGRSFGEIAGADYQAISGGFKGINEQMAVTRAGVALGVAGNADIVKSTEIVVKALNSQNRSFTEANKTAAELWGITRDGIITVDQLGRFLKDLPLTANLADISFTELGGAISFATAKGADASSIMDMLRTSLIKLDQLGLNRGTLLERIRDFAGKGIGELTRVLGDQQAARGIQILTSDLDGYEAAVKKAATVQKDFNDGIALMTGGALSEWEQAMQRINDRWTDLGNIITQHPQILRLIDKTVAMFESGRLMSLIPGGGGTALLARRGREVRAGAAGRAGDDLAARGVAAAAELRATLAANALADAFDRLGAIVAGGPIPFPTSSPAMLPRPFTGTGAPFQQGPSMRGGEFLSPAHFEAVDFASEMDRFTDSLARATETTQAMGGLKPEVDDLEKGMSSAEKAAWGAAIGMTSLMRSLFGGDNATGAAIGSLLGSLLAIPFGPVGGAIGSNVGGLLGSQFQSGGFTGGRGGQVHKNEFVFDPMAVRNSGVGALERIQALARSGSTISIGDINVSGTSGSPNAVAAATVRGITSALRRANLTGQGALDQSANLG